MQIQTYKWLCIIPGIALVLSSCSISDWYNGYYVDRSTMKNYFAKESAYYAAQTPEWNEAFKKNTLECNELAARPENRVHMDGFTKPVANAGLYYRCMEEKGTKAYR